ncbi:MAG TPA: BlaI/MecI/CopY family transcriptional regulator [Rhodothermales bacterium]
MAPATSIQSRDESAPLHARLSRRERQIMDVVYRLGEGTVSDIVSTMTDRPAYNSIRVTLGILERKGFLQHRQDGPRYVYTPTVPVESARHSLMKHMVRTFFQDSPSQAILTLLDLQATRLTKQDLDEISVRLERARRGAS